MIGGYHRAIGKIDPYTDTVTWTHKAIVNTETVPNAGADPDHWYRIDSYQAYGNQASGGNEFVAPMIMPTQSAMPSFRRLDLHSSKSISMDYEI